MFTSDPMRESPTKLRCAILEEAMTTVDFSSQAGPMITPRSRTTPPRRYAVEAMKHDRWIWKWEREGKRCDIVLDSQEHSGLGLWCLAARAHVAGDAPVTALLVVPL